MTYGTTCNLNGENTYYAYGFGTFLHEFNRTHSTCSLELIDIVPGKYEGKPIRRLFQKYGSLATLRADHLLCFETAFLSIKN